MISISRLSSSSTSHPEGNGMSKKGSIELSQHKQSAPINPITETAISWSLQSPANKQNMTNNQINDQSIPKKESNQVMRITQRKTDRGFRQLKVSNLQINSNFQVQLYGTKVKSEADILWLITETARRQIKITEHIPKLSMLQETNQSEQANTISQNSSEDFPLKLQSWVEVLPYAGLYALHDNTQHEMFDRGSEHEDPLCTILSQRLLQQLHYFNLKDIAISANIVVVSNDLQFPSTLRNPLAHQQLLENQMQRHLEFFKEKAQEFIIKKFVNCTKEGLAFTTANQGASPVFNKMIRQRQFSSNQGSARKGINGNDLELQQARTIRNNLMSAGTQHGKLPKTAFNNIFNGNSTAPFSRSRYSMNKTPLKVDTRLLSPNEYINQHIIQETSPQTIKNRFATMKSQQGVRQQPLIKLKVTERVDKESVLISSLRHSFKLSEQDFASALSNYTQALRTLHKSHLLELKNHSSHNNHYPLMFQLLGYIVCLFKNYPDSSHLIMEKMHMIIQQESLKQVMVRIDPFEQVSLPNAMRILNEIDNQQEIFKGVTSNKHLSAIESMLKFVYNACIIVVGSRVFGYSPKQDTNQSRAKSSQDGKSSTYSSLRKRKQSEFSNYKGDFIKPKHLFFSNETQQLQVAHAIPMTIPIFNVHETLPSHIMRDHFDEVELPDIDLYNYNEVSLAKYVPKTSPIFQMYKDRSQPKVFPLEEIEDKIRYMPLSNDGVLQYAKENLPDTLPTAVLIKLADMMKARRKEVYEHNDVNIRINRQMFKLK